MQISSIFNFFKKTKFTEPEWVKETKTSEMNFPPKQEIPDSIKSPDCFKQILHETEEELGIVFSPSQIKLMQVKSTPLKECISGSKILDSEGTTAQNVNQEVPKTKDEMLKELRDFVVEKNNIEVNQWDSEVAWDEKAIALETEHDITAMRFEKKEIGEMISM